MLFRKLWIFTSGHRECSSGNTLSERVMIPCSRVHSNDQLFGDEGDDISPSLQWQAATLMVVRGTMTVESPTSSVIAIAIIKTANNAQEHLTVVLVMHRLRWVGFQVERVTNSNCGDGHDTIRDRDFWWRISVDQISLWRGGLLVKSCLRRDGNHMVLVIGGADLVTVLR
ncbi:hypothetical protein OH492_20505 [Vibrio chagasii]|nr:hypothetical protein [Vibrio chagasii]